MEQTFNLIMQKAEVNQNILSKIEQSQGIKAFESRKYKKNDKVNQSSQDEFQPLFHTMKKMKMPINKKRLSLGVWSTYQNLVYLNFIQNNKIYFQTQISRREERVFCKLSELLGNKRTPDQCRSHHNKLLNRHKRSIEGIINQQQKKNVLKKLKQKPPIQVRQVNKQIELQFPTQSNDLKPNSSINSANQSLQFQHSKEESQSKEKIISPFYTITTCKQSYRIIIEINEASIRSY